MGYNTQIIPPTPLNASFDSEAEQILDSSGYALQLAFSGSTCSFSSKIQVSTDEYDPNNPPVHWDDLANSSQTFTTAGTFTYNVNPAEYVSVRVVITDNSSGANNGTISANLNVKGPL